MCDGTLAAVGGKVEHSIIAISLPQQCFPVTSIKTVPLSCSSAVNAIRMVLLREDTVPHQVVYLRD